MAVTTAVLMAMAGGGLASVLMLTPAKRPVVVDLATTTRGGLIAVTTKLYGLLREMAPATLAAIAPAGTASRALHAAAASSGEDPSRIAIVYSASTEPSSNLRPLWPRRLATTTSSTSTRPTGNRKMFANDSAMAGATAGS